jgi:hypothetical protein
MGFASHCGFASKVNELLSFTPWLQPGDQREK